MKRLMILTAVAMLATANLSKAQTDPLAAQYYTNQYLGNPAMAGVNKGIAINASYRKMFEGFDNAPVSQVVSADYGFNKVGVGINFNNDKAGLLRQTRAVATFAYHLPLSQSQKLRFGLSLGMLNQFIDQDGVVGQSDVLVGQYNGSRRTYLDGDFGVAYSANNFTLQGAVPNLKQFLKRDVIQTADVATFFAAASYRFNLSKGENNLSLEPKVAFRGVKGFDNVIDAGLQLGIVDQQVFITGIYHSSNSATFGLGMNLKKKYLVSGMYTTQTSQLAGYSNGNFELNLRFSAWK